jgi:hypothetical protein
MSLQHILYVFIVLRSTALFHSISQTIPTFPSRECKFQMQSWPCFAVTILYALASSRHPCFCICFHACCALLLIIYLPAVCYYYSGSISSIVIGQLHCFMSTSLSKIPSISLQLQSVQLYNCAFPSIFFRTSTVLLSNSQCPASASFSVFLPFRSLPPTSDLRILFSLFDATVLSWLVAYIRRLCVPFLLHCAANVEESLHKLADLTEAAEFEGFRKPPTPLSEPEKPAPEPFLRHRLRSRLPFWRSASLLSFSGSLQSISCSLGPLAVPSPLRGQLPTMPLHLSTQILSTRQWPAWPPLQQCCKSAIPLSSSAPWGSFRKRKTNSA